MKILFFLTSAKPGGAERDALFWGEKLQKKGHQPFFLLPENGELITLLSELNLKYEVLNLGTRLSILNRYSTFSTQIIALWDTALYLKRFLYFIREKKITHIFTFGFKAEILSVLSSYFCSIKIHWFLVHSITQSKIYWFLAKKPKKLYAVSKNIFSKVPNSLQFKTSVLYPQIALSGQHGFYPISLRYANRKFNFSQYQKNKIRIGMVSCFSSWKGLELFLEALTLLSPLTKKKVEVYLFGDVIYTTEGHSHYKKEISKKINSHPFNIRWLKFVSNPRLAFGMLDIVIHASTLEEPFGRVIAEAMACKKTIITSAIGGPKEFVKDNYNGLYFKIGDSSSLAKKIELAVTQPQLRTKLSQNAFISIKKFTRKTFELPIAC